MSGTDTKKMRSKIFLAVLLLTPILVVTFSTLYFLSGMSPEGTKNNGVFFKSYFDLNDFKNIEGKQDLIKFEDGKWILSVYVTNIDSSEESIYLARQLNVALNRDINKLKRVIFYSNKLLEPNLKDIKLQYPRVEIIEDKNGVLLNVLQRNSSLDFNIENPIFVIDPYGRAVMYFLPDTDPKLILKDLKVLI
ncbi:MAG: hypothetical protein CM15mP76_10160 [Prochlorococcus sp.]|jgi:hypothetical protein|nr:MAG: hypothetical protein CM15mP76_10160 [Prochlorococcus sp.]|tara:strand:- start:314 stop:889 length:576 start_codon:yes stop_codon:yes gene_type:complete